MSEAHPFERRYTRAGIRLLAVVDAAMGQMSGPATRALMRRQYEMFGDGRFERLARLSNGHLYNLRRSVTCRRRRTVVGKTQATHNAMHQGDLDGAKACPRMSPSGGVYHINMVDDVTQFQFVGTVEAISERFLLPVLEGLIEAFPFVVQGIHADNGSEYVNHRVAALLNKLRIGEFTKSRPRHCNDNALVCPIAASTFGFQTNQGLHRSFVHFNIALPFTHFPTPTTAPSTSYLQAHLRIGKD